MNNSTKDHRRLQAEKEALKLREKELYIQQQRALKRQKEFRENTFIWNEHILPRWYELHSSNKVKDMCCKGIPPNIRGRVWPLMIKNDLKIDAELFELLNIEVVQVYGVNFSANRKLSTEGEEPPHISSYRDSLLHIFDEAHPLYPGQPETSLSTLPTSTSLAALHHDMVITNLGLDNNADNAPPSPIIEDDSNAIKTAFVDITEEAWFENERDASLKDSDYDFIQRQLFQYTQEVNEIIEAVNSSSLSSSPPPRGSKQSSSCNNLDNAEDVLVGKEIIYEADNGTFNQDSCTNLCQVTEKNELGELTLFQPINNSIADENSIIDSPYSTPQRRIRQYSEGYLVKAGLIVNNNLSSNPNLPKLNIQQHKELTPSQQQHSGSSDSFHSPNSINFNYNKSNGSLVSSATTDTRSRSNTRSSFVSVDGTSFLLVNNAPILISDDNYFDDDAIKEEVYPNNHHHHLLEYQLGGSNQELDDDDADCENHHRHHSVHSKSQDLMKRSISLATKYSVEEKSHLMNSMSLIEWDLPRTYPTLGFFHDHGPMHSGLERVLMCYVCYKPNLGYVQGMSYLVATLLLYMDEFEAFRCLCNLLEQSLTMQFFSIQKQAIDAYVLCFNYYFKKLLPLLFAHMENEGISAEMYLMDWIMSLFTKTLPLETAAHIWDVYLFEGEIYLLLVALGILKMYAAVLSTFKLEKILSFLLHLPQELSSDELFQNISQIQISKSSYDKIRLKMAVKSYGSVESYQQSLKKMQDNTRRNSTTSIQQQHRTTMSSRISSNHQNSSILQEERQKQNHNKNQTNSFYDKYKKKSMLWLQGRSYHDNYNKSSSSSTK